MSRLSATLDGPGQGRLHVSHEANPMDAVHPDARGCIDVRLLTRGRCQPMGNGDARPPVLRPGAMDAARLPSLMGGRLVHPVGSGK